MGSSKLFLFFFEKAHLNSGVRLLFEWYCVIVIKHVTLRKFELRRSGPSVYMKQLQLRKAFFWTQFEKAFTFKKKKKEFRLRQK